MESKEILGGSMPSIDFAVGLLGQMYGDNTVIDRDVIEFGTLQGNTGKVFNELIKSHNIKFNKWWGCDSFLGLPAEDPNVIQHSNWPVGEFNATNWGGHASVEAAMESIKKYIDCGFLPIQLVAGYYSESLTDEFAKQVKPLAFIHMDCDLYISCYQALDWMARNKLLIPGTVILYDDWGNGEEYDGGESLAHKQIAEKYNLDWEFLTKPLFSPPNVNSVFRLRG